MDIYIQSRGREQDFDYTWLKVNSTSQYSEKPPIPENIQRLVRSESFSVSLVRSSGKLLLWIAGLESSDRIDFSRTKVRNAIVWVVSDSNTEEENLLRGIAARFLEGQYRETIDKAVRFSENGFEVNFAEIEKIGKREKVQAGSPNSILKIGTNNQANLTQLANELRVASLPDNIVNLVIVTGMQSKENLMGARVWRGLSKQIENLSLQEYTPPDPVAPDIINAARERAQSDTELLGDFLRSRLGLVLLFFFLFLVVYSFLIISKKPGTTITTDPQAGTPTSTPATTTAPTTPTPTVTPSESVTSSPSVPNPTPTQTTPISPSPSLTSKTNPTLPRPTPSEKSNPALGAYTVKQGDILSEIYEKCKINQSDIVSIADPNTKKDIKDQILKDPNTLPNASIIQFKALQGNSQLSNCK